MLKMFSPAQAGVKLVGGLMDGQIGSHHGLTPVLWDRAGTLLPAF
jgi:hypothetical protein